MQNLPKDVLDAGRLDGVGALRRVFAIDIPLLMPQFRIVVILSGVYAVQNFVPILLLTNGGPGTATLVPGLDMFQSAFQNDQYGYGMAIGTLLFVVMLIFTLVAMRCFRAPRPPDSPESPSTPPGGEDSMLTDLPSLAVAVGPGPPRSAWPLPSCSGSAAVGGSVASRPCCRPTPGPITRPTTPACKS